MARDIKALIEQMTLEEKAGLLSGGDFWRLKGIERLGIPAVMVSDGPHGLRMQRQEAENDHLGINDSIEAVCFPAACATASSFDRDLLKTLGEALGDECQAEGLSVILGPATNIKRSPLCGRNFEYYSEDPYLAGELASAQIAGTQSKNVGTSLKHFAANNQEYHRFGVSSEVDERTLREIYLVAFEKAVKQVQPWTIMCSYNRINGVFAGEDEKLLTGILRDEWGFEGYVMSDWGAVNDRVKGLEAGMELEMPGSQGVNDVQIVAAVQKGELNESVLDRAVERILTITFRYVDNAVKKAYDKNAHHALAARIESECAVLLKNEKNILPLKNDQSIAIVGQFAEKPRFQGGGSSHINAFKVVSALDKVKDSPNIAYAPGFPSDRDEKVEGWLDEAVKLAAGAEVCVVFAGLPDSFESEGYDRTHMRLPNCQIALIEAVCGVQKNVVVVLHNGSPIEMPWADKVRGILEMYLGGQGVGEAAIELLFGEANPCGKLAETFPLKLSDNPSYLNFPGDGKTVHYQEGVYVGYRWYDSREMGVQYPFGYGLSYTQYAYSNLTISDKKIDDTQSAVVSVDVKNMGDRAGKEIVQLYIADKTGATGRPAKELMGFEKLALAPGETKTAMFTLSKRSFAWYNESIMDWYCASGTYEILIGASSRDIRLTGVIEVESTAKLPFRVDQNTRIEEIMADPRTAPIAAQMLTKAMPFGGDVVEKKTDTAVNDEMMARMMMETPLRALRNFGGIPQEQLDGIIAQLNAQLE